MISGWNFEDFSVVEMVVSGGNDTPKTIQSISTHRNHICPSSPLPSLSLLPPRTARMQSLVKNYEKKAEELLEKPVGYLYGGGVDTRKFLLRTRECVGGNLIADIFLDYFSKKGYISSLFFPFFLHFVRLIYYMD